jgi:hypothetical protein
MKAIATWEKGSESKILRVFLMSFIVFVGF